MQYGEPIIRKTVPLALGLVSASNPQLPILDTLSKYSHDNDLQVALNAIFAMGLVGAGTNNARLGQMLRQLAGYYHKEPDCLFIVRIAQGLVNMGKGTITINPFFHDRQIMSRTAVAGLLSTLLAFTDAKSCEWYSAYFVVVYHLTVLRSHLGQVSLDALLPRHGHVPQNADYAKRGAQELPCDGSRGTGKLRPNFPMDTTDISCP